MVTQAEGDPTHLAGPVSSSELYLRTWTSLKSEIAASVEDARGTERNTLLLCTGVWAYLAGRPTATPVPTLLWYVPIILAAFGAIRVIALMISINPRASYLRELERKVFIGLSQPGWEMYFRTHYRRGVGITMFVFWLGLILAGFIVQKVRPF